MKIPEEPYKKIYLFSTLLVSFALLAFLIQSLVFNKNQNRNLPVSFSFVQSTDTVSPNANLKLILNPMYYNISFLRVRIFFDPQVLQLTDEVSTEGSLSKIISMTPEYDANTTGNIEVVLAKNPGDPAPVGNFVVANLMFVKTGQEESEITIVDEDTQVVDENSNVVPFTTNFTTIASN